MCCECSSSLEPAFVFKYQGVTGTCQGITPLQPGEAFLDALVSEMCIKAEPGSTCGRSNHFCLFWVYLMQARAPVFASALPGQSHTHLPETLVPRILSPSCESSSA